MYFFTDLYHNLTILNPTLEVYLQIFKYHYIYKVLEVFPKTNSGCRDFFLSEQQDKKWP